MRTALAAAKAVLDKENATDSEIQAAIIQMTQAINAMEYGTNKVHLEAIIEVAEKTLANPGDYADVSALEAAVKAGKEILAKPDATQEEADAAANAIADSMHKALMERADIRSLRELTDAANELLKRTAASIPMTLQKHCRMQLPMQKKSWVKTENPMQRSMKLTIRSLMPLSDLR